jgi:hypothetical protein
LKARRARNEVLQVVKENNFKPRLLYPVKLSFIIEGEIKNFHDNQKLKQFMNTKQALQKLLKGILHTEEQGKCNHENVGTKINLTI